MYKLPRKSLNDKKVKNIMLKIKKSHLYIVDPLLVF